MTYATYHLIPESFLIKEDFLIKLCVYCQAAHIYFFISQTSKSAIFITK